MKWRTHETCYHPTRDGEDGLPALAAVILDVRTGGPTDVRMRVCALNDGTYVVDRVHVNGPALLSFRRVPTLNLALRLAAEYLEMHDAACQRAWATVSVVAGSVRGTEDREKIVAEGLRALDEMIGGAKP